MPCLARRPQGGGLKAALAPVERLRATPWRGRHCHRLSSIVRDGLQLSVRLVAGSLQVGCALVAGFVAPSMSVGCALDAGRRADGCAPVAAEDASTTRA